MKNLIKATKQKLRNSLSNSLQATDIIVDEYEGFLRSGVRVVPDSEYHPNWQLTDEPALSENDYGESSRIRIGYANRETEMMTASPLISSPLRAELVQETYLDEARRAQILKMRQLLNFDPEEYVPSTTSRSLDLEADYDGGAAIAQAATLVRPQEIKLVQLHRRRRSHDSLESDTDSEASLSLAETLVNQSAEQLIRDQVFRQSHSNLAYEVEVLMANARADQERLRSWIGSMQGVVERLEQRRKSDARLDASLRLLQHPPPTPTVNPRRRSTHP